MPGRNIRPGILHLNLLFLRGHALCLIFTRVGVNTMADKILVVEDDEGIARYLSLELRHEGYDVSLARDGRAALELAGEGPWAAILLDVMLPYLNGVEVCRRIKAHSAVPIILLTARDAISDRVAGLDAGADDYLTKPFAIEELLARIRVQLRRRLPQEGPLLFGDLSINQRSREVSRGQQTVELTKREFDLLEFLAINTNRVQTREAILERVWGYDFLGDTNVVDVYIRYLRAKLDDPFPDKLIHTVRGVGYVLKEHRNVT